MALTRKHFIPISPGKQADFEHADIYRRKSPATSRLYVAHTGADRIEVIECSSNSYVRSLLDVPGVAGILIDSKQDFLFSSDRRCARASIYRCSDETLLGRVLVGDRPNGLAYDPDRRHLFVFNIGDPPGVNCTTSVVAVDEMRVITTVPLPAPDVVMHDAALGRLYVAIGSPGAVCVIDDQSLKMLQTVPTEPGAHTIGWNPDTRTLYAFLPRSAGAAVFIEK